MKHLQLFEHFEQAAMDKTISILKNYNVIEEDLYDIENDTITIYTIKDKQFGYFLDNQISIEVDLDIKTTVWNVEYHDYGDSIDAKEKRIVKKYLEELSDVIAKEDVIVNWEEDEDYN